MCADVCLQCDSHVAIGSGEKYLRGSELTPQPPTSAESPAEVEEEEDGNVVLLITVNWSCQYSFM